MVSVADLIEPNILISLTTPSDYRLGQEIVANQGVEFLEFGPLRVYTRVTSGQTRHVTLQSQDNALMWECTCSSNRKKLCKHAVATALATWDKSPNRKNND